MREGLYRYVWKKKILKKINNVISYMNSAA